MSAIWGQISLNHSELPNDIDEKMQAPFHKNCIIERYENKKDGHIYMGCGIQYITTESHKEALPIFDACNGIYFTADCIIDNRDELIDALKGHGDEPDGTLMYLAYLKWGIDCLKHFRGLFSMAVYDANTETVYLATDQTSSRCLYYHCDSNFTTFSTLMAPILQLTPHISYNENYLKDYLTAPHLMPNIVSFETPYTDIFKLNPGTYLTINSASVSETQYWHPSMEKNKYKHFTAKGYAKQFRQLYAECVSDTLRCNGEIGIALSSGLDSASVGALAATKLQSQNKKLYTYTYVPFEEPDAPKEWNHITNEQQDVEQIVRMYPNMIPHFLNNHGKNCLTNLPAELQIMEIPFKAIVNMPNLCEIFENAHNQGCKVLLTGQCGNSTVSHGYIDDVLYDLYSNGRKIRFLRYLNHYSKTVKESRKEALKGCIRYFRHSTTVYQNPVFQYTPTNEFLTAKILENYPMEARYRQDNNIFFESLPTPCWLYKKYLYKASMYTYMGELETKMGLANGIVIRDATKDLRILHFCYQLPYHLFAYKGTPRWLIREPLKDLLPQSLLRNCMRYGVQNADYLKRIIRDKDVLIPWIQEYLDSFPYAKWIDFPKVEHLLEQLRKDSIPSEDIFKLNFLLYLNNISLFR